VDFSARDALLAELSDAGPAEAFARDDDGGPKIWLISRLLSHRRAFPAVYDRSSGYEPLEITGEHADRFIGFTRTGGLAVIVPRLATSTADPWTGTEVVLPAGRWISVLTGHQVEGGRLRAATLLQQFPVQVLARQA
jgi:(1->4)-alpha-D-glucan 1-alpha-D-glucosylmutase